MKKYFLCIPFTYGMNTRAKTLMHRISFIVVFIMPIMINIFIMLDGNIQWLSVALAISSEYVIYEIGYIYNDVYTVKKEKKPTKWIKPEYLEFVNINYPVLIASRVLFLGVAIVLLRLMFVEKNEIFILCMALMYCIFTAHNFFRNKVNMLTNCLLQVFKYCSPIILFSKDIFDLRFCIYIFFQIALVRSVEYVITKEYFLPKLKMNTIDQGRVCYYLILTLVVEILSIHFKIIKEMMIVTLLLLLFRAICMLISKSSIVSARRRANSET